MSLQIVGLKGGVHTGVALSNISNHIHGERLAQAREVEILFEMQTRMSPCLVLHKLDIVLCRIKRMCALCTSVGLLF